MKVDKQRLRREAWRGEPVFWRPGKGETLRPPTSRTAPASTRSSPSARTSRKMITETRLFSETRPTFPAWGDKRESR